ncbi:hypothetical protein CsSME_00032680 [Camellia sinensis var. sinensis]
MVEWPLGLLQVPGVILDHFARKLDNLEGSKDTSSIDTLSFIFLVTTKDSTLRTALLSGLKLFGEKYDYELLAKRDECKRLVRLYKEAHFFNFIEAFKICETNRLSNCDFYLELRLEGCPDFNKGEQ